MLDGFHAGLLPQKDLGTAPAVNFRMAIGKGRRAGTRMIAGRQIGQLLDDHVDRKITVINAIVPLVDEDQRLAGGQGNNIRHFVEQAEALIPEGAVASLRKTTLTSSPLPPGQEGTMVVWSS